MTFSANNGGDDLRTMQTVAPASAPAEDRPASVNQRTDETVAPPDIEAEAESEASPEATEPHLQETLPPPAALETIVPAHAPDGPQPGAISPGRGRATPTPNRDAHTEPPEVHHGLKPGVIVDGQYELIRELGRGGMGVVYLARDIRLGRLVAVKFVLLREGPARKRFLAEAQTTARCTHQNIVVVHEADEFHGLPYMVLEYLEGKTLRHVMDEHANQAQSAKRAHRGLSAARTLEIMLPVLRALERAHGMGIVHRDLKPENVILTDDGVIKVLDFGIAKSVSAAPDGDVAVDTERSPGLAPAYLSAQAAPETRAGGLVGTLPYMSPEQLNAETVDLRVDIWAIGIMLFEMIAGHHPMAPLSMLTFEGIAEVAVAMPRSGDLCPGVGALGPVIDRCLLKDKDDRIASVTELIVELEPQVPGHRGVALADDASPFTGLSAFQESDADRFFGRGEDTLAVVSRVREQPLVAVVGPSGAGKSSLVRAGVIPTLKRSGEGWQSFIARPGRAPLLALAEIADRLGSLTTTRSPRSLSGRAPRRSGDVDELAAEAGRDVVVARLRTEPGYLGAALRTYAQRKLRRVLLFIDQFEELYTLCADEDERAAFLSCLAGVADDAGSPLRVVLSMRADFLERLAENRSFMALATRGLTLLPPMGRSGLQAALEKPLAAVGYGFESGETVRDMLDGLEGTRGALPLLQFAATTLWKERDRKRRLLTEDSYRAMGGIAGTLAQHADSVVLAMTEERRKLARIIIERLVTPERTRAVVSVAELREAGGATDRAVEDVLDELARARLVVVDTGSVEIVHESLIDGWPMLRRWLDEHQEDAAFLARLRTSAREWERSERSTGMLWRGEVAAAARRWRDGYTGDVAALEQGFLDAVFAHAKRTRRDRRRMLYAGFALLAVLALVAAVAITKAQNEAALKNSKAQLQRSLDESEALRAELARLKEKESQRADSAELARNKEAAVNAELKKAKAELVATQEETERQRQRAVEEANRADEARQEAEAARRLAEQRAEEADTAREEAEKHKQDLKKANAELTKEQARLKEQRAKNKRLLRLLGMDKPAD